MKTEIKMINSRQAGVTLVELLIGIVVIGLVIAGVMIAAQKVFTGSETNRAASSVAMLASNVKGIYTSSPSYAGLTNAVVINGNLAPESMVSGANLVNEWGGAVTVAPATLGAVANNAISITYADVPTEACMKLAVQTATNFDQVTVDNGTPVNVVTPTNRVVDQAVVATACGGAATVSMIWQKK